MFMVFSKVKELVAGQWFVQDSALSYFVLGRVQGVLREKIPGFVIPQDLLNDIPNIFLNLIERI